jgi:basic membrane protein A
MPMLSRLSAALLGIALVLCIPLAGCNKPPAPPANAGPKIGLVTDSNGLGDKSFNDEAYAALQDAERRLHIQLDVLESRSSSDYFSNLTLMATKDTDLTIAIGFDMAKDVAAVGRRWPKRSFAIIDAIVNIPNVTSVTFREQDGAFLAGSLAAMVTKTRTIAFLGGIDTPQLRRVEAGFTAGARQVDPAVKVIASYVGSNYDIDGGKRNAHDLFGKHADIVFIAAGKAGLGAFDEVKSHKTDYVIGTETDQDALAPGRVLTSMVKRIDIGIFRLCEDTISQKPLSGQLDLGLAEGAIGLTDTAVTHKALTDRNRELLASIDRAIVDGTIAVPTNRKELSTFKPAALGV